MIVYAGTFSNYWCGLREARVRLNMLADRLRLVNAQILETDRLIRTSARVTEGGRRLMGIFGLGPLLANTIVATMAVPSAFKTRRRPP